jgi:hypothetical protein
VDTSALHACFLRQSLEFSLKKDFQMLRCQEGNRNSSGLAAPGLDSHAVWGFGRLRFWSHAIHLFSGATKAAGNNLCILAHPPCIGIGIPSENPVQWFVIECTDQKLAVIKWDLTAATSPKARHFCGEAHAQVYINGRRIPIGIRMAH